LITIAEYTSPSEARKVSTVTGDRDGSAAYAELAVTIDITATKPIPAKLLDTLDMTKTPHEMDR
jgi:hypothetical protein